MRPTTAPEKEIPSSSPTTSTPPKSAPAVPAPSATPVPAAPQTAATPPRTSAEPNKQAEAAYGYLPNGEYTLLVESVPKGATVVVNGIPIGKAPQRVVLPGTQRGFFRDQVSLKVRFIAADAEHPSYTMEELLTPLDKIPAVVRFTSAGVTRVPR
jgi:hypothetical protein